MRPEIKIRNAQLSDSNQIAELIRELGYPNTPDFFKSRLDILAQTGADRVLVAERGSKILGFMTLHFLPLPHLDGNLCRVVALVVTEGARRQGIGAKLMMAAEEIARVQGCIKMELTSGEHREDAHAFYRAIGYEEVSRRFVKML